MATDAESSEDQNTIPKPEVTDDHREKAREMAKAYEDDRPTAVLPGTAHTVTGQAVADWIDDDGTSKQEDADEEGGVKRSDVAGERHATMSEQERG